MKHPSLLPVIVSALIALGATHYVDDNAQYYVSFPYGSIPQPNAEWRFADGLDWDTTGAGEYRNYGSDDLATELTDVNRPGLEEGLLAPHQSALDWDGVNDYLQIDDPDVLDVDSTDFSFVIWMKLKSANQWPVYKINSNGFGMEALSVTNPDQIGFAVQTSGGNAKPVVQTDDLFDQWHMIGCVFDWDSKTAGIQMDDGSFNTQSNGSMSSFGSTNNFLLGRSSTNRLKGQVSWFAFWEDVELTSQQLDSLYEAMHPAGTQALPYSSIQTALHHISSGDTIYALDGSYQETVAMTTSGTIFAADNSFGSRPVIFGSNLPAAAGTDGIILSDQVKLGWTDVRGYDAGYGIFADSTSDGSVLHKVVVDSCLTGIGIRGAAEDDSVLNCTLDGAGIAGSRGVATITAGEGNGIVITVLNSVFVNCDTAVIQADSFLVTSDYNAYWSNTVDLEGLDFGVHDLSVNPLFQGGNDHRPKAASRVLNAGVDVGLPFLQSAPDMGAWETIARPRAAGWSWGRPMRMKWGR